MTDPEQTGIGPYSEEELDDYGRTYEYYCPKGCWQELARNTDAPNSPTGLPRNPDCPECGWYANIGSVRCRYGDEDHDGLRADGSGDLERGGGERPDRARFECTCGSSTTFPKESFAKLHWLVGRFGYKNTESAMNDIRDCCDRPDYMETRGWEEMREDGDGLRTDGGQDVVDFRQHIDAALARARHAQTDRVEFATLAFAEEHVPAIRDGEKTITLRRPGEYDVAVRHAAAQDSEILLVDADGDAFARAAIDAVWKCDAETVAESRLGGYTQDLHNADDVVRVLERYYELELPGDPEHVRVHAIHFDVVELLRAAQIEGGDE